MHAARIRLRALLVVASTLVVSAGFERVANAKDAPMYFAVEGYGAWLRQAPNMQLRGDSAPLDLIGLATPPTSGVGLVGFGADVGFGDDSHMLRVLHLRYARGFSAYDASARSEGVPLTLAAQSMNLLEVSGLTFAARVKVSEGLRVELVPDVGVGYAWGSIAVTGATRSATYTFDNAYVYVRAELDLCGKLEEQRWLCLSAAPNVAQFGPAFPNAWFTGGSAGLRVEL